MKSSTYRQVTDEAPDFINRILELEDVTSVFHALDFVSVDKVPEKPTGETLIPKLNRRSHPGNR